MSQLIIPASIRAQMLTQAAAELPDECCGFLVGNLDHVSHRLPLVNIAATPGNRFESSPTSTLAAYRTMRELGVRVLAIYHSHPDGTQVPSRVDLEMHDAHDAAMIIIAPADGIIRGWHVSRGSIVQEIELATN